MRIILAWRLPSAEFDDEWMDAEELGGIIYLSDNARRLMQLNIQCLLNIVQIKIIPPSFDLCTFQLKNAHEQ